MAESAQWTVGNPGNSVSVITTTDNTVIATIAVANQPLGVAFSPDGTKAYTANHTGNDVSVINTADNTLLGGPITVGNGPYGVAVSPDGTKAYVVNRLSNNVSVIDLRAPVTSVGQLRTKDGSPTCWPPLFHWSHKSV